MAESATGGGGTRRRNEVFGAGGFYLVALGGGVLIGPAVAVLFVCIGSGLLALAGLSTEAIQRHVPDVGRFPLVHDHAYRVLSAGFVDSLEAKLAAPKEEGRPQAERVTFNAIKPRIEQYVDEGRALYLALADDPPPEEVGSLYDAAGEWERRATADLERYHPGLAQNFEWGGSIVSPQWKAIQPTDAETLRVYIRRRGQVLRNVLDGTPGKDLEW